MTIAVDREVKHQSKQTNKQNPLKGTFTNNVDPDEMLHNAAFHQALHCLPNCKEKRHILGHCNLKIVTYYHTPQSTQWTIQYWMEDFISQKCVHEHTANKEGPAIFWVTTVGLPKQSALLKHT